jgi:hypothetical protein
VAATARGKAARKRGLGQQATWRDPRVPKEATGAAGRWRVRVVARAQGCGGNGGGAARGGTLGSEEGFK